MLQLIPLGIGLGVVWISGCNRDKPPAAKINKQKVPPKKPQNVHTSRNANGKKITPNGIYNGAFLSDSASIESIKSYTDGTKENLDFQVIFYAFTKGLKFPGADCATMSSRKITPFIKLEPWSWNGAADNSYSLKNIIRGDFDGGIEEFARGAKEFKKPIFISFAHEMNGNWYPWGQKPEEYIKAYKHVVDIFRKAGADNVTWAWNVNQDPMNFDIYYPGGDYVDWVAVDGYSTRWDDNSRRLNNAQELFGSAIKGLKKYKKPIMIGETGYDMQNGGSRAGEKIFLESLIDFCKTNEIAGLVYFNENKTEVNKTREYKLNGESQNILADAIDSKKNLFGTSIKTAEPFSEESQKNKVPKPSAQHSIAKPASAKKTEKPTWDRDETQAVTDPKYPVNQKIMHILNGDDIFNPDEEAKKEIIKNNIRAALVGNHHSGSDKTFLDYIDTLIAAGKDKEAYKTFYELLHLKSKKGYLLIDMIEQMSGNGIGHSDPWFSGNIYRKFAEVCSFYVDKNRVAMPYLLYAKQKLVKAEILIANYYREQASFPINDNSTRSKNIDLFLNSFKDNNDPTSTSAPPKRIPDLFKYIESCLINIDRQGQEIINLNREDAPFDKVMEAYKTLGSLKNREIGGKTILDIYDDPKTNNPWLKVYVDVNIADALFRIVDKKDTKNKSNILSAKHRTLLNNRESLALKPADQRLTVDEKITILNTALNSHLYPALIFLISYYGKRIIPEIKDPVKQKELSEMIAGINLKSISILDRPKVFEVYIAPISKALRENNLLKEANTFEKLYAQDVEHHIHSAYWRLGFCYFNKSNEIMATNYGKSSVRGARIPLVKKLAKD